MGKPIKRLEMKRHNLYEKFAEMGYKVGAEIGVFRGKNAADICRTVPGVKLYGIDPWRPMSDKGKFSPLNQRKNYRRMKRNAGEFLRNGTFKVIVETSMEAVKHFKDGSLDFVYIDADHRFDYVMQDIIEWSKKVRIGGIVSGHDYTRSFRRTVMLAVNTYVSAHRISPWYITGREDNKRSPQNSFFWEKC